MHYQFRIMKSLKVMMSVVNFFKNKAPQVFTVCQSVYDVKTHHILFSNETHEN